jgi:hypothetical protein
MPTKAELQTTLDETRAELAEMAEMVMGLRRYVLSNKFHCNDSLDGYVSVQDVLNRLDI